MKHPVQKYDFDTLFTQLSKRVEDGLVDVKLQGDLRLFNYSQQCQHDKLWDDFTRSARGLILDLKEKRVAALPFPKFHNFGELAEPLPNEGFKVYTKYDGSLGIIYHHDGTWHVATRGSFDSEQAVWATQWLRTHLPAELREPWATNFTLLAEIIYPSNKIVVDYNGWEGLVLLSVYDTHLMSEMEPGSIALYENVRETQGWKVCETESYDSIDKLLEVAKVLGHNEEGFVVRFDSGYRIKIKGEAYCRVHKIVSGITPLRVWEHLRNRDDLDGIVKTVPDEFQKEFSRIKEVLLGQIWAIIKEAKDLYAKHKNLPSRKDFAMAIGKGPIAGLCFMLLDGANDDRLFDYASKLVRPTGNDLNLL